MRAHAVLALCALASCDGRGADLGEHGVTLWTADEAGAQQRRILTADWDTLAALPGGEQDTLLYYPHRIAAHAGGVYVYDDGAHRLVSFDSSLCLRAVSGRKGSGPGEFAGVRDLTVTPRGDAALLDQANRRVTLVGADGGVRGMLPLRTLAAPEQLAFVGPDNFVVFSRHEEAGPFVVVDTAGTEVGRIPFPWDGFGRMSPLSSHGRLAEAGDGSGRWVFVFGYGNGWFSFDREQTREVRGRFVEHTEFPFPFRTPDGIQLPPAPSSGVSAALGDSLLYVLFGGRGDDALRNIDLYRVHDGAYVGTYVLPEQALSIALRGTDLYVLFQNPHPSLYLLRPRTAPRPRAHAARVTKPAAPACDRVSPGGRA